MPLGASSEAPVISLFCYEPTALAGLLQAGRRVVARDPRQFDGPSVTVATGLVSGFYLGLELNPAVLPVLGAGADPEVGRAAAMEDRDRIAERGREIQQGKGRPEFPGGLQERGPVHDRGHDVESVFQHGFGQGQHGAGGISKDD